MKMIDLLKKIYPLRLAPVSEDTDKAVEILCEELPFFIHEFPSGEEYNGWQVPYSWKPIKGQIWKNDKCIYDGMKHPLGIVGYSTSFEGEIYLEELKKHLFYHPHFPDALVYHCDYYYKPWRRDWGFSVPYNLYKSLSPGKYYVVLKTQICEGTMKVLDYFLEGRRKDTIILNAHNCHAGQANDDISGVVVGIEVMKRLSKKKQRKYSYRLIIAPEHLGTVFYLKKVPLDEVSCFKYAIFLEMLGNDNRFALQESFTGDTLIDRAAHHYLYFHFPDYYGDKFRKIVGNDETVWEAPGYEIPCISLSRAPYPEYHSDKDNEEIISEERLEEAVKVVMGILEILETNTTLIRKFKGLVALSNPKYNLYIPTADPSIRPKVSEENRKWNYLMDCIVRYFEGKLTILDIAEKHQIEYFSLYEYLKKFKKVGLVDFVEDSF